MDIRSRAYTREEERLYDYGIRSNLGFKKKKHLSDENGENGDG